MAEPDRGAHRTRLAIHLVLAALLGALAVTILLALVAWVFHAPVQPFDDAVLHALTHRRTEAWDQVALHVTALANTTTLAVLVFWAALFLWRARRPVAAVVLVVTAVGGRLLTELLKALFDRTRPEILEWGAHATSAAFPSAHAMSAAVVFGAMAYLLAGDSADDPVTARRALAWTAAILLTLAVAASRVYLGVHYPSDVAAGIVAGALWTTCLMTALPKGRATREP